MTKRITIASGVIVCLALLVYAILASSPSREPGTADTAESATLGTAAGSINDAGDGSRIPAATGRVDALPDALDPTTVRNATGIPGIAGSEESTSSPTHSSSEPGAMPSLEELHDSAAYAGPGPSQIDLGLPGPAMDLRTEAARGAVLGEPVEASLRTDGDQPAQLAVEPGPSQVDLGLPGPSSSVRDFEAAAQRDEDNEGGARPDLPAQ